MAAGIGAGRRKERCGVTYDSQTEGISTIKALAGDIKVGELFSRQFMREYTFLSSIEMLFTLVDSRVDSLDEIPLLCTVDMDDAVRSNTEFNTWNEMVNTACDYYIANNIK